MSNTSKITTIEIDDSLDKLGDWDFFDEKVHVLNRAPATAKFMIVGVDYGTINPCAFTMISFNDQVATCLFVEKEYYWDSKVRGRQKTDSEYAKDLLEFIDGYSIKGVATSYGTTGTRAFCSDQTGVIRFNLAGTATTSSAAGSVGCSTSAMTPLQ